MNAGDAANSAAIQRFQRRWDELTGRREEHRSVRLAGQASKIEARPRRAQLASLLDVIVAAGNDPYLMPAVQRDLDDITESPDFHRLDFTCFLLPG